MLPFGTATAPDRPAARKRSTLATAAIASLLAALGLLIAQLALAAPASAALADGSIAFTSDRDGNDDVWTMNADGSEQTRLTTNGASDYWPRFSPDGTRIAFASDRGGGYDVFAMNADGTGEARLTNNGSLFAFTPDWSPDGTKIAFAKDVVENNEIHVMNADGSGERRLTFRGDSDEAPDWSPDGTKIAFAYHGDGDYEIWTMNADGSDLRKLTSNVVNDQVPHYSPDGTKIAFARQDLGGDYEIWTMGADGSGLRKLTSNAIDDYYPDFSPDGTEIAFARDVGGSNFEIYAMNADGSAPTRLTNNAGDDLWPDWSLTPVEDAEDVADSAVEDAEDVAGNFITPPSGVPSADCTSPSQTVIDGYFGPLFARLKVQDQGTETWVCTRLQREGQTELAGGKLVVRDGSTVEEDENFGACSAQSGNILPGPHPFVSGQVGDPDDPPFVPYLLDAYANDEGSAWVCLRASLGARVMLNGPAVFEQDDPVFALSPPRTPWPVGKASADCETRAGGTRTQFVNANIAGTQVWLDAWQSASRAQLCVRAEGPDSAGGVLTVDATGSPGVTPVLQVGSDAAPCTTTVFTNDQQQLAVKRSPTGANPASVCVTQGTQTTRVTVGFTGSADPPDVDFTEDDDSLSL